MARKQSRGSSEKEGKEEARSKSRLRALPDRLHDTLELLSEAFFMLDTEWRFIYMNHAAEALLSRSRSELVGRNIWDEFPEAVGTESDVGYHQAMAEQSTVRFEQHYPPLGKWFEAEAHPVPDGLAVYFRDVTPRKEREEQLRQQAALLDAANDAIFVMNLDHHVVYWNAGAEKIYRHSRQEVMGLNARDVLGADEDVFAQAIESLQTHGTYAGEVVHLRKGGEPIRADCRWSLVSSEDGKPSTILAIHSDVTQTRALEAQFLRAQRMESIGALAGGIAHDLNNTLTPTLLAAGLIDKSNLTDDQIDCLRTIETSTRRGAAMVKQLLAFARGSTEQRVRVQLAGVAEELRQIVKDSFPKNIDLSLELLGDVRDVEGDPTQLHQVLTNLCVNARDAMPDGGRLSVEFSTVEIDELYVKMNLEARVGSYVMISVEDTGVGIPNHQLDRIFDPFFTTKELGKGTGLGLSTTHAIVRNHGGFIRVYSELKRGTTFKVYLPALPPSDGEAVQSESLSEYPPGKGELLLVVDDEEPVREMACRILKQYGYRVIAAENGAKAISRLAQMREKVSLVLTDMTMPVMDGPATVVAVRTIDPNIAIIGASGLGANRAVADSLRAGMNGFIAKPYTADVLLQKVHQILRELRGATRS